MRSVICILNLKVFHTFDFDISCTLEVEENLVEDSAF